MSNEHFILVKESGNTEEEINAVVNPLSEQISGYDLIDAPDPDSYDGKFSDVSRIEVSVPRAYFFSEDGRLLFISPHSIVPGEEKSLASHLYSTDDLLKNCGVSKELRELIVANLSLRASCYILTRRQKDIEVINTIDEALFQNSSEGDTKMWRNLIQI